MDTTSATAAKVEAAREQKGISRSALAEAAGIPYATLHRKLNGQSPFTVPDIDVIARVLGVNPASLVEFRFVA